MASDRMRLSWPAVPWALRGHYRNQPLRQLATTLQRRGTCRRRRQRRRRRRRTRSKPQRRPISRGGDRRSDPPRRACPTPDDTGRADPTSGRPEAASSRPECNREPSVPARRRLGPRSAKRPAHSPPPLQRVDSFAESASPPPAQPLALGRLGPGRARRKAAWVWARHTE